ncbi:hypothetical protein R3P38DRAFT_2802274 [Favolaschia claudopus]|uniref:Bacteriophage T5 Orf172 DNA-binding domain-containing protein n=1 Tax=Favolaschia claudopus TaxID=2862362 RepID=A0AAV9ZTG4_9AGAR
MARTRVPYHPKLVPWPASQTKKFMRKFARMTPLQRLKFLARLNPYKDYKGYIYALRQDYFDAVTGQWRSIVKYGLTNNFARRRREYKKCGTIEWLYHWRTDCVKLTEATIHARLRHQGVNVKAFPCACTHHHREFFWEDCIGTQADIRKVVEDVLRDTAQPIISGQQTSRIWHKHARNKYRDYVQCNGLTLLGVADITTLSSQSQQFANSTPYAS